MRLPDEVARAKLLAIAKQNIIINEFFSAGPFKSHDEAIDGSNPISSPVNERVLSII